MSREQIIHCDRCGADYTIPACQEKVWDETLVTPMAKQGGWRECGNRPAVQSIVERGEINPGLMYTASYVVCKEHTTKEYHDHDLNFDGYFDTYKRTSSVGHWCSLWGRLMVRFGRRA